MLAIREAQEADSKIRIAGFNQTETTEAVSTNNTQIEDDANTLKDSSPEVDSKVTETAPEEDNYDIRLRESVRIMRDWVLWESGQSHSASALSALSDESGKPLALNGEGLDSDPADTNPDVTPLPSSPSPVPI